MGTDSQSLLLLFLKFISCPASLERGLSETSLIATARAIFLLRVILSGKGLSFTERDLYYTNPVLFGSQGQRAVHRSLERLCILMDVGRVTASFANGRSSPSSEGTVFLRSLLTNPSKALHEAQELGGRQERLAREGTATEARPPSAPSPSTRSRYTREGLCVVAAPRSVLVGPLTFTLNGREVSVAQSGQDGLLVSSEMARGSHSFSWDFADECQDGGGENKGSPVLVFVEKECTLRHMLDALFRHSGHDCYRRRFCFLCTKGYPCIASRQFLRRIHEQWPALPMVGLVDGDPHGLRILLTLLAPVTEQTKQEAGGSGESAEESISRYLPVRWLGMKPSTVVAQSKRSAAGAVMALTEHDIAVLKSLRSRLALLNAHASSHPTCQATEQTIREMLREAEWMAIAKLKCELQAGDPLSLLFSAPFP